MSMKKITLQCIWGLIDILGLYVVVKAIFFGTSPFSNFDDITLGLLLMYIGINEEWKVSNS